MRKRETLYTARILTGTTCPCAGLYSLVPLPIAIANDADAAGWAEYVAGAGKGSQSCVTITLGTGVGGGIVLNGKLFSGGMAGGGELGM